MSRRRKIALFVPVLMGLVVLPVRAKAQGATDWEAGRLYATREGLQQMLSKFQEASDSKGYSDAVSNIAQDEAELIRARLTDGDFQVGDQVVLTVAGQPLLTATFPVSSGRVILLPDIGEVSVAGLLRSELQEGLTTRLAKYIRNPEVYAKSQIRLGIFGEITNPGYHTIPAEMVITEVLMTAGGPTRTAKQKDMKIRRGDQVIWEGDALQRALIEGRTVDQMNLRAGDEIDMPGDSQRSWGAVLRSIAYLVPLGFAISRLF
jgi:polysaccharide export outer membrane protein